MKSLNIDDIDLDFIDNAPKLQFDFTSVGPDETGEERKDIAIIGLAGRIGKAENVEEFWEYLKKGEDFYQGLSEGRKKDADQYSSLLVGDVESRQNYIEGTLLNDIAGFDYEFFGLSMQEAKCMDPNQRILLENTWKALEDAGYAKDAVEGSTTGVFVGFSSDFGLNYRNMIHRLNPSLSELAITGNVASMIASRISYQLNLHGPAVMTDTACSSGLMAVYQACRALQNKECSMAVAGASKCNPYPVWYDETLGDGVRIVGDTRSDNKRTNTYDDRCSGTILSEGVITFVLKPYQDAVQDGDNIYAVILGGSRNQDGKSNGITAPNVLAQEELLCDAWRDAGIEPEQISYIENHGTATRLGDPIEIKAITEAFRNYTDKHQFCAVGTVKTNIGHMDHASGLAGLLKLSLSFRKECIPKSIYFQEPNQGINFIDSPVYVEDQTINWKEKGEERRIAGISSFGISGTNCHLVLGSHKREKEKEEEISRILFPLSAKNPDVLRKLTEEYADYLLQSDNTMQDILHTAILGRYHFNYRLMAVARSRKELIDLLRNYAEGKETKGERDFLLSGKFRIVGSSSQKHAKFDCTLDEIKEISANVQNYNEELSMDEIHAWAQAYVKGAEMPWHTYVRTFGGKTVSIPTYPFRNIRCWVDRAVFKKNKAEERKMICSMNMDLLLENIRVDSCWELREHTLNSIPVFPGTVLMNKMLSFIREQYQSFGNVVLQNIQFEKPFGIDQHESRQLQMIVSKNKENFSFQFVSCDGDGAWVEHATAEYLPEQAEKGIQNYNIPEWKKRVSVMVQSQQKQDMERGIKVSERWSKSLKACYSTRERNEFLFELELMEKYQKETADYRMHPALLDIAVNAVSGCMGEAETYLPFSYGKFTFYQDLPSHIFVHAKKRRGNSGSEIYSFDLIITDENGVVAAEAENYAIKKLPKGDFKLGRGLKVQTVEFSPCSMPEEKEELHGKILYCGRKEDSLYQSLAVQEEFHITFVDVESSDIKGRLEYIKEEQYSFGVFQWNPVYRQEKELDFILCTPLEQCVEFLNAVTLFKINFQMGLGIITYHAARVTDEDKAVYPEQAAIFGAAGVIGKENMRLKLCCIDVDEAIENEVLIREISSKVRSGTVYYRRNLPYETKLKEMTQTQIAVENKKNEGVVIVTGGMGEIGRKVCNMLYKRGFSHVIAAGHNAKNIDNEKELNPAIDKVVVDIGQYEDVERVLSYARTKYGKIQGLIHMAGKPGEGFAVNKSKEVFHGVYDGKAIGAVNLYQASKQDDLQFIIFFSSIASLTKDPGQSDYTAANMVLDAVSQKASIDGRSCLSIQWPAFEEVGMAYYMKAVNKNDIFSPIHVEEALEIVYDAVCGKYSNYSVITPGNMKVINKTLVGKEALHSNKQETVHIFGVETVDDVLENVAGIWGRTLDIAELDVNEEFLKLGGNSLLSMMMLKEYENIYPEMMEIADLFSYTTAAKQADYIRQKLNVDEKQLNEKEQVKQEKPFNADDKCSAVLDALADGKISVEESLQYL